MFFASSNRWSEEKKNKKNKNLIQILFFLVETVFPDMIRMFLGLDYCCPWKERTKLPRPPETCAEFKLKSGIASFSQPARTIGLLPRFLLNKKPHPHPLTRVEREREVVQSCPTLCDPMDCSLPSSSVHEIFQAIELEWIAISFSRGSSQPGIEPRSPSS